MWLILGQTPYANGWDAYFYLVQVESLITEGRMHSSDYSLVYPLLLLFRWVSGNGVLAYKLCASFIYACYALVLYFAGKQWCPRYALLAGICIALFGLFNPVAVFMDAQFLKNFTGMVLLIAMLVAVPRNRWLIILPLFLATLITHRICGVLAGIALLIQLAQKRYWIYLLITAGLSLIAVCFLPGVLHLADLNRFNHEFRLIPGFAPWSLILFYGFEHLHWSWYIMLAAGIIVWILCFAVFFDQEMRESRRMALIFLLMGVVLLFPFLMFNADGPALRLTLSFFVLAPLFLPLARSLMRQKLLVLLSVIFLAGSAFSWQAYRPALFDPPYKLYQAVSENSKRYLPVYKNTTLVIAHKGLAEFFTYTQQIDAMPWQPEPGMDTGTMMRISSKVEYPQFAMHLDSSAMDSIHPLGVSYFLLPERIWQTFRSRIDPKDSLLMQAVYSWQNPYRVRPDYITRKRKS